MSKVVEILTNRTKLFQIAAIVGFSAAGMGYLTRWKIINKIQKGDYYKLAVCNLHSHTPLVNLLGQPLCFGTPDIGDSGENYATLGQAKFNVPVKGSEGKGSMLFEASRNFEDSASKWHLDSLQCDVEKTEKTGQKLKGRVNVPIKYKTIDEIPDGIYSDKNNSTNTHSSPSSTSPTVSTPTITSSA